jgi:Cd2+/Zn2+-exporting ATPase
MAIAVLGAVGIQKYGEAAAIVVLYMFSLLLESKSTDKARQALQDLLKFTPLTATVKRNGREVSIPAEQIHVGEIIVIRPGERLPLDGEVVSGSSSLDQAPITGESMPVPKRTGDAVFAGSFNQLGTLDVRVTKIATDSTLARIIHLVEDAQSKKAPMQTFVERFALYYTPTVFALAILVAAVPPLAFGAGFLDWFYRALVLLVVACPCAFVISTPVSLISAMTNAARHGILLKGGKHLETLAKVRAVAFDKTGTLTRGKPVVTDILSLNGMSPNDILRVAASAELKSEHPLAEALLVKAQESGISMSDAQVEEFTAIAGKGIRATIDGKKFVVGNHQLIEDMGVCSPEVEEMLQRLELQGKTALVLSDERSVLGVIAVADRIRAESATVVKELHRLGIEKVVLLTGDNDATASATAAELSLDEVKAQLLPQEKLLAIQELKSRHAPVVMVGDGINDAPALAAADVGIAMGRAGSDTALETADVVLMSDNIAKVPYAIALGKRTFRIIKQNIALALLTKLVFLVLGVFGLTSLWLAILADDGATILVLANGMRLLKTKT